MNLGKRIRRATARKRVKTQYGDMVGLDDTPDEFGIPEGLTETVLPSGLATAPFAWHTRDATRPMEFVAGFVGAMQNPETLAVRPALGWAVRRATADAA
jgi:hypothetical protein